MLTFTLRCHSGRGSGARVGGEVVFNGTCDDCCPCCGFDQTSLGFYECGDVPTGGSVVNDSYVNWTPGGQPKVWQRSKQAQVRGSPRILRRFERWNNTHAVVQYLAPAPGNPPTQSFPACGLGGLCDC